MSEVRLTAERRTEFGKGAARRARRAGKIPAVLYGHGSDPQHVALPAQEFARVVREHGTNAVVSLEVGGQSQLALTKTVTVHPIRQYIEHVDLLMVRRGEKVVVDVNVVVTGTAAFETLVTQESASVQVEADALAIPEEIEVSVEGAEPGTRILAGDLVLPLGVALRSDPEQLVVNVVSTPTTEEREPEAEAGGPTTAAPTEKAAATQEP